MLMRDKLAKFSCSIGSITGSHRFGYFLGQECTHSISIGLLLSSFWRRTCLVLMLLLVALLLTGCDDFYDLIIENYTDQEVIVRVPIGLEFRVRPCSVKIISSIAGRPYSPLEVEAQDTGGHIIYTARFPPKWEGRGQVYVRMPTEGPGACPTPVRGTFMLLVKNYLKQEASVWLDNVELGSVQALSTQSFGPLPGTWETKKKIKFLDSEGKSLLWAIDVDYNLGQVPQFFAYITPQ